MPFVTQDATNSCGAYCLCYLKWLNDDRRPESPLTEEQAKMDRDQIKDVYAAVQFGDGQPTLPPTIPVPKDYCDPMRMILLLQSNGIHVDFSISRGSTMYPVFQAMNLPNAREHAFIRALEAAERLQFENPRLPGPGQAAIAIYNIADSDETILGQHYILFRNHEGLLFRYNPWDGEEVRCDGYTKFTYIPVPGTQYTLSSADAAIVTV